MPRKRLISPEFFTHEALYEHEANTGLPLRVAFAGLWTQADRRGIFRWRPRQLKLAILPYDVCEFSAVLEALLTAEFIQRYEVDSEPYGIIPTFTRWQTFHKAENPSDAPTPDGHRASTVLLHAEHPSRLPVAVTGTITNAVAVERSAGPEGPPPPAGRGGPPKSLADVDWRGALTKAGVSR